MYNSPIQIAVEQMARDTAKQMDDAIFTEIHRVGISVDKDELLRALAADRRQYDAGYTDGLNADRWNDAEANPPPLSVHKALVCVSLKSGVRKVSIGYYYHGSQGWAHTGTGKVTHWMPLPELPEEDDNDE